MNDASSLLISGAASLPLSLSLSLVLSVALWFSVCLSVSYPGMVYGGKAVQERTKRRQKDFPYDVPGYLFQFRWRRDFRKYAETSSDTPKLVGLFEHARHGATCCRLVVSHEATSVTH